MGKIKCPFCKNIDVIPIFSGIYEKYKCRSCWIVFYWEDKPKGGKSLKIEAPTTYRRRNTCRRKGK